jgi:hypothetical protein
MDDPRRGTGRSTGLMLKAISEALLNHCTWVEFVDHAYDATYPATPQHADMWLETIEMVCSELGLRSMRVRTRGNRIWIISLAPTRASCESAPQYPECPPLP